MITDRGEIAEMTRMLDEMTTLDVFYPVAAVTAEQAALGRKLAEWFPKIALTTAPADHLEVEAGVVLLYEESGRRQPQITWCASPSKAISAAAAAVAEGQAAASEIAWNRLDKIRAVLREKVEHRVLDTLQRELHERVRATAEPLAACVAAELGVRAHVVGQRAPRVGGVLKKLVEQAVLVPAIAGDLALSSFAEHALGLDGTGLCRAAASGLHLLWLFEETAVACGPPTVLLLDEQRRPHAASGPAIEYGDGFRVHAWHGTRIPHEAAQPGAGLDWADVERTADPAVKRALTAMRAERWVESSERPVEQSAEERREAAEGAAMLGGVAGVRGLVEGD